MVTMQEVKEWVAGWVNAHFVRKTQVELSNYVLTVPYSGTPVMTTGDQTVAGLKVFTSLLQASAGASGSSIRAGNGIELQGLAINNNWLADNIYYDGAAFRYRNNGYGVLAYNVSGDWAIYTATNNAGGANAAATVNLRMRLTNTGDLGIGTSSPQGPLHLYESPGGGIFWTHPSVGNTITIIPDGTGDAVRGVRAHWIAYNSGAGGLNSGNTQVANGASVNLFTDGASTALDLRVNANGSVDIRNSLGGGGVTWAVSMYMVWL